MKLKIIIFFFLVTTINLTAQVNDSKKVITTLHKSLLKKIKGTWNLIGVQLSRVSIDCENIEASTIKTIEKEEIDSLKRKELFHQVCNSLQNTQLFISDDVFIFEDNSNRKNDTAFIKIDTSIAKNLILIREKNKEYNTKMNVEFIDEDVFNLTTLSDTKEKQGVMKLRRIKIKD